MSEPASFTATITLRFDPWGYAADDALEVLLPTPSNDGYQRVLQVDAPPGRDITDAHGHRRLIRLERGQVATVTSRVETQRIVPGAYLDLPPPGPADHGPAPMIVPDDALRTLAAQSVEGIKDPGARITALAQAAADALRYKYPRDARGAAMSLARGWGDCGEYAFLFVALCHVAGIPARPVLGLITAPWMVTPHAWAEAWDGKGWLPVDPNLVREGSYLGPILDTGAQAQDHIGALDPYRLVLSRHTGLPWPGEKGATPATVIEGVTLTLDGLGPVPFWHDAPRWQGRPIVPFLQMPWTVIHRPRPARPTHWLHRQRIWRVSVRKPARRLPRSPWVLADIVVLHPMKGVAAVFGASAALPSLPAAAPTLQAAIWVWFGLVMLGLLRQMRLLRLRSALWLRVSAALAARTRSDRRAHRA
jgi:hypothetical protein